jgi:hypothetical protein
VSKAVSVSGDWDGTYHYYYDAWSIVEMRNGLAEPGNCFCSLAPTAIPPAGPF